MPDFEKVCLHILKQKENNEKFLIGGLITFIPFINFLLIGYLVEYASRIQNSNEITPPRWENWSDLLLNSLKGLVVIVPYFGIPCLLGLTVTNSLHILFSTIKLELLAQSITYIPLIVCSTLAFPISCAALWFYLKEDDFHSLLKIEKIITLSKAAFKYQIIPLLCFIGILAIGWPLYGFTFFLGILTFLAYSFIVFIHLQNQ